MTETWCREHFDAATRELGAPRLDVMALLAEGQGRRRRRTAVRAGGALALAAAVATPTALLAGGSEHRAVIVPGDDGSTPSAAASTTSSGGVPHYWLQQVVENGYKASGSSVVPTASQTHASWAGHERPSFNQNGGGPVVGGADPFPNWDAYTAPTDPEGLKTFLLQGSDIAPGSDTRDSLFTLGIVRLLNPGPDAFFRGVVSLMGTLRGVTVTQGVDSRGRTATITTGHLGAHDQSRIDVFTDATSGRILEQDQYSQGNSGETPAGTLDYRYVYLQDGPVDQPPAVG